MTWPTTRKECEKEPFISFLVPEGNIVKEGDSVFGNEHKYQIDEVLSINKSHRTGYNSVKIKVTRTN
ncbi:hypothetical protein [Flavobacterium sp. UBA4197]|uniref:hypothetical protein n=1 Tax=Flavobacterium sp. UBA4197 TaxID=1946546 RepID=UPI0025810395|nr:hypothetical protein [Flavobacterium sp. UBA4197]